MTVLRRLHACRNGAAIVEFALVAPVFFLMLFGIVEGSRMLWTQQTLDEVAFNTARCMAVSDTCATSAAQEAHAVARARGYGIALTGVNIAAVPGTTCRGYAGSSAVTIRLPFASPVRGFVPGMPATLQASACFPEMD